MQISCPRYLSNPNRMILSSSLCVRDLGIGDCDGRCVVYQSELCRINLQIQSVTTEVAAADGRVPSSHVSAIVRYSIVTCHT